MKLVIFGLTISSSWGNGHATVWRSLSRELIARGHKVVFFERDVPYYSAHRDMPELPGGTLHLYESWDEVRTLAEREVRDADVAMTTSYCPDALPAAELIWTSPTTRVFYDLDTPVTLARLERGEAVPYLHANGLGEFDLVLSFTGGFALDALRDNLGARVVAPLYGSVDPAIHRPVPAADQFRSSLSYLGTYSADRQDAVAELLIQPAQLSPNRRFLVGGAQYPAEFPWRENIFFVQHLAPDAHPTFYCSSRLTLNVTRAAMREMGWCPSGRLFEAAACGTPIISDTWEGLEEFFQPGAEIITAARAKDVLNALELSDAELLSIARAARERTLTEHTGAHRARELEDLLCDARLAEAAVA